ncbi:hypothetical protein CLV51_10293 [Chitinophaga niastensis]|uniref:Uncharacterized protein n=1 Tax=Chitinophaga niastensis TaxID=536980 RepID=A0A2P8HM07_CHINA|nr:hypothetical protein [Chitinophaga niastensis]PSL47248.1 hypothetical protein CLV51_10293 [Chitinophaga niastensis]
MKIKTSVLSIAFGVISAVAVAQVKGDDDGILAQQADTRDKVAIDAAVT